MDDEEHTPQERTSPAPSKQRDAQESVVPTLTPEDIEKRAQRLASARKVFPVADEEEIERSRERGGPHPDVPPTEVTPPKN